MKGAVRLREEADVDLAAAASWYEQQRAGLGHEFLDIDREAAAHVPDHAQKYPTRVDTSISVRDLLSC